MKKLIFIATEDWFFASHFLPMLRAAREAGFAPAVICRVREHRAAIEAEGARVIAFEADRGRRELGQAFATITGLARILRAEQPAIVHLIALWPIVLGGIAARLAGVEAPHLRRDRARLPRRLELARRTGLAPRGTVSPAWAARRTERRAFFSKIPDDARLLGFASG